VFLVALACLLLPSLAAAQSQLIGVAKDTSGGVLPGVLVEASSPVLIEGTRSVTTDEQGRFLLIDLRPGEYSVTFTLTGFQVVKRDKIEVPAEQTVTVNVELRLGTVSEVLTVSGSAPVVDIQNAVKVTSLDRSTIDNLPLGNNIWEMAQLIPAIDMYQSFTAQVSAVGGNMGAVQTYMSTHGKTSAQNVVMVDGMSVSGLELDGTMQAYFNNAMNSEVTYQTSGISADRSGGGVTVNMIPREGGNRYSGDGKFSYRPNAWIADNRSGRLRDMGVTGNSSLKYLADETISEGGPIMQNKLWFFASFHQFDTADLVANTVFDSGEQGYNNQQIQQVSGRLTYQVAPSNKLTGYYDKTWKRQSHAMGAQDDPETASNKWKTPDYSTGNLKLTSTLTPKLLLEGGFSFNREYRDVFAQDGIAKERYTPEWYASASRTLQTGGARTTAPSAMTQAWPGRDNYQASVSYVTGGHQIKAGVQYQTGTFFHSTNANADLTQRYGLQTLVGNEWVFSQPLDVTARNTPVESQDSLKKDIGIYVQDSWRLNRLTLNAGLRWEHVNSQNDAWTAPEGRFAPARTIPAVINTPDWYDWAPRFSAVYDLFGDSRTALKYTLNRYNRSAATQLAQGFNTLNSITRTLTWIDNGDDIPQGGRTFTYNPDGSVLSYVDCGGAPYPTPGVCEINMPALNQGNAIFGTPADADEYQGFPRTWNLEQSFEVQHALTRRLSLTGSYIYGADRDLSKTVNQNVQPGDYIPVQIYNPIDGTPITAWSLKDIATRDRQNLAGGNVSYIEPLRRNIYEAWSLEFRMRPYAGAQIFGGFTAERSASEDCATSLPGFTVRPTTLRFCDRYNLAGIDDHGPLEQAVGITDPGGRTPFGKDLRLGISLPLPWYGINFGVSYINNDSAGYSPTFTIIPAGASATRYTDGNPNGTSATRRIASQTAPPCHAPCVPGALVFDPAGNLAAAGLTSFILPTGSTSYSVDLYPDGNLGGRIRRERLNQLDLKVSKTFRFGNLSVLPTFEAFNVLNVDSMFQYASGTWATTGGNYLVPSSVIQSRILGFGVQVRW
jgi:hypothetical protein